MQIEIIRQDPRFKIEINSDEFEFLFRLLGNHVVGEGRFRTISNNIFESLDSCNNMYCLGTPKGALPNNTSSFIRLV